MGPGLGKILGCECGGKENSFSPPVRSSPDFLQRSHGDDQRSHSEEEVTRNVLDQSKVGMLALRDHT